MASTKRMPVMQVLKSSSNRDKQLRWSDIPEVKESLTYMSKNINLINLNETKFEIISQESSFNLRLQSLLNTSFVWRTLTEMDKKILFSSIEKVLKVSDDFLVDLEKCWQKDIFLPGIFDAIRKHESNFEAYARHCSNQKSIMLHLEKLKTRNKEFLGVLDKWQNFPDNYSKLSLECFFDMPKGRITCLAATSENASSLIDKNDPEYKSCLLSIKSAKKVAEKCDQAVAKDSQRTKLLKIFDQLTFSDQVTPIAIASSSRELVKIEEMTLLRLAGAKVTKGSPRHIILFNDLLLITKKAKREERYEIYDYCSLRNVELKNPDDLLSLMQGSSLAESQNKLLYLKLKENYENKPVVLLFSLTLEAKCDEWHKTLEHHISRNMPQPVVELRDDVPEQPPLVNRTSMELQIIEELKKKQEARKRDWVVTHEIVEDEVEDKLGNIRDRKSYASPQPNDSGAVNVRGTKPYLIPRPATMVLPLSDHSGMPRKSPAAQHYLEPPVVPAKPRSKSQEEIKPVAKKESGIEATVTFDSLIEYPPGMMVFPLVSASRWLIMKGEMVLRWHHEGKKYSDSKVMLNVALFNDVFFVTSLVSKKKSGNRYKVLTYCMRNMVDFTAVKQLQHMPSKLTNDRDGKFTFTISILENHKHVAETMVVSVGSAVERDSWLAALPPRPAFADNGKDVTFDPWDCPYVLALKPHIPAADYELALAANDKIHVIRQRADGWYEGERVSDGERGFFPEHVVVETDSPFRHANEVRLQLQSTEGRK